MKVNLLRIIGGKLDINCLKSEKKGILEPEKQTLPISYIIDKFSKFITLLFIFLSVRITLFIIITTLFIVFEVLLLLVLHQQFKIGIIKFFFFILISSSSRFVFYLCRIASFFAELLRRHFFGQFFFTGSLSLLLIGHLVVNVEE